SRLRRLLTWRNAVALTAALALAGFGGSRIVAKRAAVKLPAPPRCQPTVMNRSAILPGTPLAVSPLPESLDASPRTQISLLGAAQLGHVQVSGSSSGAHTGSLRGYTQGDGA